jgi:WD40 repeat protein
LLFDSSPLLASAVCAGPGGHLLTGRDAEIAALSRPAGLEANPKRRIDDGAIWLGEREYPVVDLVAAVLARVGGEARRVAGGPPAAVVLTHPAVWGGTRLAVLADAAARAGLGTVDLVAEPVAAAAYFATVLGRRFPEGRSLVVYDLGAGTFDVSVVRAARAGFEVVAAAGLDDVGGLDLDAAVVGHTRALTVGEAGWWARLDRPETPADRVARHALWRGACAVKEQLSRHATAEMHVPLFDTAVHLTREEFERAATPHLERTATLTWSVLREAGVTREEIVGVFLVGGSSRIPLAATLLHRTLGIAPTALDHPELVVAEGSLNARPAAQVAPAPAAVVPAEAAPAEAAPAAAEVAPADGAAGAAVARPAQDLVRRRRVTRRTVLLAGTLATAATAAAAVTVVALRPWADRPVRGARLLAELAGHSHPVYSVAFSPDSKALAAGGGDYTAVRLWDVPKRRPTDDRLAGHPAGVTGVVFSPDGRTLATTCYDNRVRLWTLATREPAGDPLVARGNLGGVAFSPNRTTLAVGDGETVRLWHVVTRRPIGPPLAGHTSDILGVAFLPEGKTLVTGDRDGTVRFWDVAGGRPDGDLLDSRGSAVFTGAVSPDGRSFATSGPDHTVRLWDVATRRPAGDPLTGHTGRVAGMAFSTDSTTLATGSDDHTVRLWNVATRRPVGEPLTGHTAVVYSVAFSPDGTMLATGSEDKTIRLWEITR